MANFLEKEDEKFREMMTKQNYDEPLLVPEDDKISNDDMRMDDLLVLQSMNEETPVQKTLEQKYEEEIAFKQVTDLIRKHFSDKRESQED